MPKSIRTHLMFEGLAEEAMNYYVEHFPRSEVLSVARHEGGDFDGKIQLATFSLDGSEFICIDSPVKHDFEFTPSMSIFVDCDSKAELHALFGALSDGGEVLMPLGEYGFSEEFGWVKDRWGVSWQINLP